MLLYLKLEGLLIAFLKFGTAVSAAGFYWFFIATRTTIRIERVSISRRSSAEF
ncbi:hypothetical protein LEP1GSC043_4628 [Leptospira weilii str. Ecochallenge]|uniref:Uncharacterized protein n=1 Tax=Leptospira weilii str. Ecochallenge TaxID=1049986 RepID=N1U3T4_9LEPT|nr:hypothetical protein LEP1GSC043_4628 [Leptospira weilii str. Ecochallenge]